MSKTFHSLERAFTPGLSPKEEALEVAQLLSESYLVLDDEALAAIERIATEQHPMVRALVDDPYGGAMFSPTEAQRLSVECQTLIAEADSLGSIWLATIAAFAATAGAHGKYLCAHAD
jgi:hypothetical protein